MNRFIIVDGYPYLVADGKAFSVRWDENGFTVGAEVEMPSAPSFTYSELSIQAKCQGKLDSIALQGGGKPAKKAAKKKTDEE